MATTHQLRFDELKAAGRLPTPTGVALTVLRLVESERSTIPEIARVLETDPAMAGRILKIANSASSGMSRPITIVKEAVTRLGVRAARNVALGFSLLSESRQGACKHFDYMGFSSRSLATGVAAQAIASHLKNVPPDEAFTCGLLCRIGSLALATIYPAEYGDILTLAGDATADQLADLERERFLMDHNELTAALLKDWGLPHDHAVAARYHEHPDHEELTKGSRSHGLARTLFLASHLAGVCVVTEDRREDMVPELFARGELLGINSNALVVLGDRVVGAWHEWGKVLQLNTQPVPSFVDLAARASSPEADEPKELSVAEAGADALRVLIVTQDPAQLQTLRRSLTAAGHAVLGAGSRDEGLRVVLETNPHLLLLDWLTPPGESLALCKGLREARIGKQMYIMLLTDSTDEERLVKAFEAGVDEYVVKPVNPRLLTAQIRAGQRILQLQEEVNRDKEELRHYAAELAVANRRLQQDALEDVLTGLPNRRCAVDRLNQEWASAVRTGRPLACLVADIDRFKQVNDTYGHDIGDIVLRETAHAIRNTLRTTDLVCRLGGEEFVVICRDTTLEGGRLCAERIRARVEKNAIHAPPYSGGVTLSVGAAAREETMRHADDLLKTADVALYQAKQTGRNRVYVAAGAIDLSKPARAAIH